MFGNPNDRFSHEVAHFMKCKVVLSIIIQFTPSMLEVLAEICIHTLVCVALDSPLSSSFLLIPLYRSALYRLVLYRSAWLRSAFLAENKG